jgi:hypothetical protein
VGGRTITGIGGGGFHFPISESESFGTVQSHTI